jgi:hypothetical protein
MQPLGDAEELRIPVQNQPAVLDPSPLPVCEQRLQHFGHPTTTPG